MQWEILSKTGENDVAVVMKNKKLAPYNNSEEKVPSKGGIFSFIYGESCTKLE